MDAQSGAVPISASVALSMSSTLTSSADEDAATTFNFASGSVGGSESTSAPNAPAVSSATSAEGGNAASGLPSVPSNSAATSSLASLASSLGVSSNTLIFGGLAIGGVLLVVLLLSGSPAPHK